MREELLGHARVAEARAIEAERRAAESAAKCAAAVAEVTRSEVRVLQREAELRNALQVRCCYSRPEQPSAVWLCG